MKKKLDRVTNITTIYNDKRSTLLEFYTQKRRSHADSVMRLLLKECFFSKHSNIIVNFTRKCRLCTISLHICMKIMQLPFACSRSRSKYFKFIYLRSTFEHQNETNWSDFWTNKSLQIFQNNQTERLGFGTF